jgi:hypothetical protein
MPAEQLIVKLTQGENVSKNDPVKHSWFDLYSQDPGSRLVVCIQQCENDVPPSRAGPTVTNSCTITCTTLTPFALLPDYINGAGEKIKKRDFDLVMIPSGASVDFAVYINGIKLGSSNISVQV